ncbi:Mbeg1-like protein [Neobacillus bataviensis]|uniref:Mbeg1-like protein n=1 Tax=Neobacillus bataviensis TaxID=220685 RepID=UPI001CBAA8D1|nr:Mbeg1-like protein [Neobacillus bataviensis]
MSLNTLNDEEKNILLQLSYFDLPEGRTKGLTVEQIWEKVKRLPDNGGDVRREKLEEYFHSDRFKHSNLANVTLKGYQNNNPNMGGKSESGFVGYAWEDQDGNATAVFRGSEDMKNPDHLKTDWGSNALAFLGIEIQQQKEAGKFYEQFIKNSPGEKFVFGHSKGGNLAAYVLVHYYDINKDLKAYIINGAPLYWDTLSSSQREVLSGDRNNFIVYEGDIVSQLGTAPYVDRTVKINDPDYDDPFYPHYETSVDFDKNGNFKDSYAGQKWYSDIVDFAVITSMYADKLVDWVGNKIREQFIVIRETTLMVIQATWKGLKAAANFAINACVKFIAGLKVVANNVIDGVKNFFEKVKNKVRLLGERIGQAFGSHSFPVEPYMKVNTQRLAYYVQKLQSIKRRTADLNDRIDSLYLEAGLSGLDNVIKADIMTTFNGRINQNISYLNTAADLLERAESKLVAKARSLH